MKKVIVYFLVAGIISGTAFAGYESYEYHPYTRYGYYQNHPYYYQNFSSGGYYPYQYNWSQHRWYAPYYSPRYQGNQGRGMNPTYHYSENSNYDNTKHGGQPGS